MATGLLNADMKTIARWLRDGMRWWLTELEALVPPRLRQREALTGAVLLIDEQGRGQIYSARGGADRDGRLTGRRLDLGVPAVQCLERIIRLPMMNQADLRDYLAIEAERLFPLPAGVMLVDAAPAGERDADGLRAVQVGAVRRADMEKLVARALEWGVEPGRLCRFDPANPDQTRYDFSRALRNEGVLPPICRLAPYWWALVAVLVLFNIGLIVWRDQQSVAQLESAVASQQPAVGVYRAIAQRAQRAEAVMRTTRERRRVQRPLADLATLSATLPDTAWVQRLTWDGRSLQFSGYVAGDADLVTALRRSPRFAQTRETSGDVQADIPIGHPFDLTIPLAGLPQ